ncbi:hypothetical protein UZ35_16515 [Heyndrickxia coagulans]|nr:hypothetical protein CIW84_16195 [Heyndrickxia coagulans]KGB30265.1 hypothetical protein IE89_05835 [Heyndrickxia coagulans]KXT19175.1 hypothetical protein UZ35_16515 [Heyndrickxia coagulans]RCS34233.1 hypothetical protein DN050_14395 [Heyndrickxia coagulans]
MCTPDFLGRCSLKGAGVQRSLRVPALFWVRCSLKNARGSAFSIARAGTYPIPAFQETLEWEHAKQGERRAFCNG